jgi:hypothetical protein
MKQREAHRKQMLLDNTHVESLISALRCDRSSCPNANNYCYELDGVHLKVMPPHMKTWSMSINDGKASIEAPPDGLIATLMPSKAGTSNPLRHGSGSKSRKSNCSSESTFPNPNIQTPVHPMYPYPPYHGLPPYYHHQYSPPPVPIEASGTRGPFRQQLQFSDSIAEEPDPLERLIAYFTWLIRKSPLQELALERAKETLIEDGHTFKMLEKLVDSDFDKMGIKPGIAMQLKAYIDLFKTKTMNHA